MAETLNPGRRFLDREISLLRAKAGQLQTFRDREAGPGLEAALMALEVATEELRVADEELCIQQAQIDELTQDYGHAAVRRGRAWAALPVPCVLADRSGSVQEANAAAARLLNVPLVRLQRKPLLSFVDVADRRRVRTALARGR